MDLRAALVGVVAVVALAVVALAGCSSVVNGHGVAAPRAADSSTGGFPSSSSASSSSPTADRPGAVESPDGDFSVLLPDGWTDGADRLSGIVLTGYFGPTIGGFALNINVLREPVGNVSMQMFLRATRTSVRTTLRVTSMSAPTPRLLDGASAFDYTVIDTQAGHALEQRQTLVIQNGNGYVITYTSPLSNYLFYRADADAILTSWQWG